MQDSFGTNIFLDPHQHLILQPIEFDHKHKNLYGYYALAAAILMLTNYLMLKERTCQISLANGLHSFEIFQSFHMIALIVSLIVFILSYFHFAMVLHEFKILFYSTGLLIVVCAIMLLYNAIAITWRPCVSFSQTGLAKRFDTSGKDQNYNIFTSQDTIGILVFAFDLVASLFLILSARRYIFLKR